MLLSREFTYADDEVFDTAMMWTAEPGRSEEELAAFKQRVGYVGVDRYSLRPSPFPEPLSDDDVQALTNTMLICQEKQRQYAELSPMGKFGQYLLATVRRDSLLTPVQPRPIYRIPELIVVNRYGDNPEEIIVNPEAEARFREVNSLKV